MSAASEAPSFAVLWDMDGVIVDSAPYHQQAWQQIWWEQGIPFSAADFRRTFGQRNDTIIFDVLGPEVPAERMAAIAEAKEVRYRALLVEGGIEPLPGATEWLRRLHARRICQAIVSSAPPENIRAVLQALGADGLFQVTISGEQVRRGKPDPESFLLAARQLGIPPARCVVVEDAPAGLQAAQRAGMAALMVTTSHSAQELASWVNVEARRPVQIVPSLVDLPEDTFDRLIEPADQFTG